MSRIAIVSYFAPPQPAVASHRVLRLSRALRAVGHEVQWVTLDPARLPKVDAALTEAIPRDLRVHGLGGVNLVDRDPTALHQKAARTLIFGLPDRFPVFDRHVEWSWRLRRHLPGIVRRERIDLVLLCCGPHGQLTVVPRLRRACPELRILVDYRDLLSGNTWRQAASEALRRRVRERERRILAQCEALFLNSEVARQSFLRTFGGIPGLDVEVMRNTADYALAETILDAAPAVDLGPGRHLGFFGTIFPRRRLLPVLQAMARLDAEVLGALTLHVYCDPVNSVALLDEDLATVGAAVRQRVVRHDYLGYGDALRAMRAMDALVLINSPDPADQIFVPGKLYDYLMARRPVLFVGERGDAWELCADVGWCFTYVEPGAVAARLGEIVAARPEDVPPHAAYGPSVSFAPLLARTR